MNLESPTIGTDEEICIAREQLPEPSRTKRTCMFIRIMPPVTPILDMPREGFECNPGFIATRRHEFVKVLATIGNTAFDAWASRTDGKVYL